MFKESEIKFSYPLDAIQGWEGPSRALTLNHVSIRFTDGKLEPLRVAYVGGGDFGLTLEEAIRGFEKSQDIPLITSAIRQESRDQGTEDRKKAKEELIESEKERYGEISVSLPFATKWVTIYSKGYVKVSSGMGLIKGDVEKLVDIFGETDITKKTGLGRAAGAVFTLGANITLSPNQRGNLYLAITTEKSTHSIMWDRPDASSIKTLNTIVSAGKGALARGRSSSHGESKLMVSEPDLATQISSLNKLRESGIISDEEFQAAKTKLLSD
tara:strand:+ start:475 stop:1284 length:810 start_codon:yes stop_codon:yes gene_type:complete